jgi:N-acetylmuramoyl-L-alanine amidase
MFSINHPRLPIPFLGWLIILFLTFSGQTEARNVSRVIIDAGHGGKDKGSHRGKVYEKNLTLQIALRVEKLLKAKGIPVTMTRRTDKFLYLKDRCAIANRYKNAIMISIHFNAHKNYRYHGIETYYFGEEGKHLAAHIHLRLLSKLKLRNRQTRKRTDLAVLRSTNCPAVLVECGYISNPYERRRAQRASYQQSCAEAIVAGILAYKTYR